jgi:hypothetical protein
MGNKNEKKSEEENLKNLAKISNPIMPLTNGKACTIEDGMVIINMRHYKKDYNLLNLNLEKLKNKMNVIISDDFIELIQKRLEGLSNITINPEIKKSIESFCEVYKTNLNNYYNLLSEIKKIYKQSNLSISNFLTNWLKVQKNTDISEENQKIEENNKKINDLKNSFNKFNEVEEIINKISYFKIDYENKDKFAEMNKYYEENKEEIANNYTFESLGQFRSVINLKEQILDTINQKNSFLEELDSFHNEYSSLYKKVLSQINSTNLEKVEIVNELNEYNGVVIYHRLIRSIEERIKKLKI